MSRTYGTTPYRFFRVPSQVMGFPCEQKGQPTPPFIRSPPFPGILGFWGFEVFVFKILSTTFSRLFAFGVLRFLNFKIRLN
jgi:hypothetical protein